MTSPDPAVSVPERVDVASDIATVETAPAGGAGTVSISDAEAALDRARRVVQTTQDKYDRIELEVDSMNLYIADMEARGESPLEHQDEIMDRFQPLLAEYLDAEVQMNEALEAEERAATNLAAARQSAGLDSSPQGAAQGKEPPRVN